MNDINYLGSSSRKISFDYDTQGNRIAKHAREAGNGTSSTYYVLDEQGNPMSIYPRIKVHANYNNLYLIERNIYGSARIGMEFL